MWVLHLVRGPGRTFLAREVLDASRVAVWEQNSYCFEIHGTAGAHFWDFRRMAELEIAYGDRYGDAPVSTLLVGPGTGDCGVFQPAAAKAMSCDDLKAPRPTTSSGRSPRGGRSDPCWPMRVGSAVLLVAMTESVARGRWVWPTDE